MTDLPLDLQSPDGITARTRALRLVSAHYAAIHEDPPDVELFNREWQAIGADVLMSGSVRDAALLALALTQLSSGILTLATTDDLPDGYLRELGPEKVLGNADAAFDDSF